MAERELLMDVNPGETIHLQGISRHSKEPVLYGYKLARVLAPSLRFVDGKGSGGERGKERHGTEEGFGTEEH